MQCTHARAACWYEYSPNFFVPPAPPQRSLDGRWDYAYTMINRSLPPLYLINGHTHVCVVYVGRIAHSHCGAWPAVAAASHKLARTRALKIRLSIQAFGLPPPPPPPPPLVRRHDCSTCLCTARRRCADHFTTMGASRTNSTNCINMRRRRQCAHIQIGWASNVLNGCAVTRGATGDCVVGCSECCVFGVQRVKNEPTKWNIICCTRASLLSHFHPNTKHIRRHLVFGRRRCSDSMACK